MQLHWLLICTVPRSYILEGLSLTERERRQGFEWWRLNESRIVIDWCDCVLFRIEGWIESGLLKAVVTLSTEKGLGSCKKQVVWRNSLLNNHPLKKSCGKASCFMQFLGNEKKRFYLWPKKVSHATSTHIHVCVGGLTDICLSFV